MAKIFLMILNSVMNYYLDTHSKHRFIFRPDSENLHISPRNQWFSLIVIKVSQRVANDQIIDGKTSLKKSVILSIIRAFLRHNDKLSKTSKISEPIISESCEQCQRNSGTSIHRLWALSKAQNNFPEIRYFLDNSGAFMRHHVKLSENSKIKKIITSESRDQCPRYSETFIYTLLALTEA